MADGGLELDTDYLLVSAAGQCWSVLGGYIGLLRPPSSIESPDVWRVMDIAKSISLGYGSIPCVLRSPINFRRGFVLSVAAVALTINASFVVGLSSEQSTKWQDSAD